MGKRSATGRSDQQEDTNKRDKMSHQGQWRQDRGGGRGGGYGGRGNRSGGRGGGGGYRTGQGSGGGGGRDKLGIGMRGFLCSCNFNERDCTKEAYNLLNEYFREDEDKIKPEGSDDNSGFQAQASGSNASGQVKAEDSTKEEVKVEEEEDIEKALKAEVKQLKSHENRFKFKSVDTEVPNLVFISTTVEDPAQLAHRILEDLHSKKEQKSKFLLRMVPIQTICKANMDDLETSFRELVPKHFPAGEYISFQIVFKSRYNGNIHREDVIKLLADIVVEENSLSVVDLTNPKCTIVVEVIKNKICLGFLKDFALYKKYNLIEVAGVPTAAPPRASGTNPTSDSAPSKPEEATSDATGET